MALTNTPIVTGGAIKTYPPTAGDGATTVDQFTTTGFGTFIANSGTHVTVADPGVTANSVFCFGLKTAGGTVAAPFVDTVTPGTGFTVNSGGSDTSTYNYLILD